MENNNTKIIISAIIIIILLAVGFHYLRKGGSGDDNGQSRATPSTIEGCYVAKLGQDVYTLDIESEKNGAVAGRLAFNNFEKDSSSGSFAGTFANDVLLGNYSFDAEGMHSDRQVIFKKSGDNFVEGFGPVQVTGNSEKLKDPASVTYDPKSTFVKTENCMETFSNNSVAFDYNAFFMTNKQETAPTTDWMLDATTKGVLLGTVVVPRGFMPNTNFSEAKLTVGRSSDPAAVKSCLVPTGAGAGVEGTDAVISGFAFKKFVFGDAGAGNRYDTTSYKGIVNGDCYAVEYTIHSTAIGNYSPDQGITEFDKTKIVNEMENIINSMHFLVSSS